MILAASSLRSLRNSWVTSSTTSRVAHPAVHVGVEVGVLGAHAAHVEREERLHRIERGGAVVGDDDVGRRADLEILAAAARAGPGESLVEPLVVGVGHARRVEDRQPAVADLGGQRDVLRPLGAQHDRDVGAQRMGDRLERLAQAGGAFAGERQRVVRAVAGDRRLAGPAPGARCRCTRGCAPAAWGTSGRTSPRRPAVRTRRGPGCAGRRTGGPGSAAAIAHAVGVRADSCTTEVPSRIRWSTRPHQASGV